MRKLVVSFAFVVVGCSSSSSEPVRYETECETKLVGAWRVVDTIKTPDAREGCALSNAGVWDVTIDKDGWHETNEKGEQETFTLDGVKDEVRSSSSTEVCAAFAAEHARALDGGRTASISRVLVFYPNEQAIRGNSTITLTAADGATLCRLVYATEATR